MNLSTAPGRLILSVLLYTALASGVLADTTRAYVHFGAILLGELPRGNHDARRQRVGYLPIGTVVGFDPAAPRVKIFNYSEDVQDFEDYIYVRSSIGFAGYIRDDLVTPLDDREILLPLRYNINIRALDSNDVLAQVSRAADRNSSTPVEVIGEDPGHYHVRLTRGGDPDAETIDGRISKPLVDSDRLVKLSRNSDRYLPEIEVDSPARFIDEKLSKFLAQVRDKTGESNEVIVEYLKQLNALRCRVSSAADAQLSAKIFGNGLGLRFSFVLAEQNAIYSIKTLAYSVDGQNYRSFYELHDVRCVDGIPHRLGNLILLDVGNPSNQIIVSREDLPAPLKQNWARFETGTSSKMIIVDGFKAYEHIMRHIGQSEFLRNLPRRDRLVLSHALLKELAYFSTPE